MLQSRGQNQIWPTSGPGGYMTPCRLRGPYASKRRTKSEVALAASGIPYPSKRGTKLEVAHKWAQWLHNPLPSKGSRCFKAKDKIRSGPQVGPVAA